MNEEKDLDINNEDNNNSNNDSINNDLPNEQNDSTNTENSANEVNNTPKAGNGYRGLASSNRQAFARGLNDNYDDRIARNQASLNEARARANNPNKMNTGHENEEEQTNPDTGESNFSEKNKLDKAKDQGNILKNKTELASSKIDKVRSEAFKVMHPGQAAKMALKVAVKTKLKAVLLNPAFLIPVCFILMFLFVLFTVVVIIEGNDGNNSSSGSIVSTSGECGFTISDTSFSKSEYKEKVCEYAKSNSKAKEFCDDADSIYDLSKASNINPELVIVRAVVEGFSPAYDKSGNIRETYRYNHWGIGCTNTGGLSACKKYPTFLNGVKGFLDVIDGYSSLIDMMTSYAFIGHNWIEGASDIGGCYYFEHMKNYYADTPEAQKSKSNAQKACAAGGTGIPTTKYDQDAYALYQVDNKMGGTRERIFGLKLNEGVSCSTNGIEGDGVTTGNMTHPCPKMKYVSSEFGPRKSPGGIGSTNHKGIDLAAVTGTPVLAADGGKVIFAGTKSAEGKYIKIDHGDGIITQYMHLSKIEVKEGDKVSKGQKIGEVGSTGNSTGPHLHFGVMKNGVNENPRKYVNF